MTPFLWSLPDSTKFGAEIGILNTQELIITSSRSVLYFSGVFCPNYLLKYFGWLILVLDKWIFSTITSISFPYPAWLAVGATEELEQEEAGGTAQRVSQKHASSD